MYRFFVIALFAAAFAEPHEGPCPEVKPVENFNLTAYQGVWYEISKLPNDNEGKGQCAQAEYTLDGTTVKVKNTHVIDKVQSYIEGTAKFEDGANNAAKLVVSFKFGPLVTESTLMILATNYNGYSIAYSCNYDKKTKMHNEQVWILSRSKKLEGDDKTAVDTFMKDSLKHVDTSKLVQTDFSDEACKFTSTSVMSEQTPKP